MHRSTLLILLASMAAGCMASKSSYHLVQAEQAIYLTRETQAPELAIYEWTKAEEFIQKAREEWGHADFGPAEDYARQSQEWAEKADKVASAQARAKAVEDAPDIVPEEVQRTEGDTQPDIQGREEKLDVDVLDDDEEE